jgi:tRNA pseudouridine55 synthase
MRLGLVTDTQDVWGRPVACAEKGFAARLCEDLILETAARFVGARMQTPPAYSAVKVAGKKLYEYARAGETVAAPAREIEIFGIDVRRVDLARGLVAFDAECSKGAYMRTLCHDMGAALGCGAAMSGLVRTVCGMFSIDDACTAEELEAAFSSGASADRFLTAIDVPLRGFPAVKLSAEASRAFVNGARISTLPRCPAPPQDAGGADGADGSRAFCRVYGDAGGRPDAFLGVGRFEADALVADKVFFDTERL